jgi:hypothetical protein
MTKFSMKWWVNLDKVPNTPQEAGKLNLQMLEMVKADMSDPSSRIWDSLATERAGTPSLR